MHTYAYVHAELYTQGITQACHFAISIFCSPLCRGQFRNIPSLHVRYHLKGFDIEDLTQSATHTPPPPPPATSVPCGGGFKFSFGPLVQMVHSFHK